jgi:hypothetical protein
MLAGGPVVGVTINTAGLACETFSIVTPSAPKDMEIVNTKSNCPAVVSAPLNTPLGLKLKPGGGFPPVIAKL